MTIAPTQGSGAQEPDAAPVDDSPRPVVRSATRVRKARQRRKRATIVQSVLTVLFVVALLALGFVGWRSSLKLTGGRDLEVTDPAAPGYVAEVKSTTADLVAVTAADGSLATMLLLLGGDGDEATTTVVPISAWLTLWEFEDAPPASAHELFGSGGIDALRLRLGVDLTFGATDAVTLPAATIEELAGSVGPITVNIPDNVIVDEGAGSVVRYAAGAVTLQPSDLMEFLSIRGDGEAEYARSLRLSQVWTELLAAVTAQGDAFELPAGASDDALTAEILGDIATSTVQLELLPTREIPLNVSPPVSLDRVDHDAMATWVPTYVPFPVSAYPGQRATVDLLNGTTDPAAIESIAPKVVTAGAEISLTGNAESFDIATSRVEYSATDARAAAEAIAGQLGLSATRTEETTRAVDVTVVVGKDLLDMTSHATGPADHARPLDLARTAALAAESKGATDILVLDVGDVLGITELFVVVTASNSPMVKAIVDEVQEHIAIEWDEKPRSVEGADGRRWVLLDFADIVVHVFLAEDRDYYRIERLYSDSVQHEWRPEGHPGLRS